MVRYLLSFVLCFTLFCIALPGYGVPACDIQNADSDSLVNKTDSLITSDSYLDSIMSKQLDEVQVSASLNRREGNKDIITITNAMREGTHNSGELLGKVAGVMYNPLTTELSYLGSKNIVVLVDGVQKDEAYII